MSYGFYVSTGQTICTKPLEEVTLPLFNGSRNCNLNEIFEQKKIDRLKNIQI